MLAAFMLAALLAWQGAGLPDQLVLSFTATDKKGRPVEDLKLEDVQVVESGAAHAIGKLELDRRPLTVALVIDSSALAGDAFRADLVPAAMNFVKRLPPESTFSVWITSDRPKRLVPDGTDAKAAEDALRGIAPYGSNAVVDTIVDASQELAKIEGRRTAIVAVTSANMGEVTIDVGAELAKVSLRPTFMSVEVIVGNQDARLEDALKALSFRTGGFHERVFSTMAVEAQMRRISDLLASQYRAAYRPTADPRSTKIEIKTSRKDVKLKLSQRLSAAW
jgi:hypothetical protein